MKNESNDVSDILILALEERWTRAESELQLVRRAASSAFRGIIKAYQHPLRHYHTLDHLRYMFDCLQEYRQRLQNPAIVDLAIFYHDIVYNTLSNDNEAKSAKKAAVDLDRMGISEELVSLTVKLIEASQQHQADPAVPDMAYFLDADLAILGAEPDQYRAYSTAVRKEYHWVPDFMYNRKRTGILESFLERKRIYHSDEFHDRLEAKARHNILSEIKRLC